MYSVCINIVTRQFISTRVVLWLSSLSEKDPKNKIKISVYTREIYCLKHTTMDCTCLHVRT